MKRMLMRVGFNTSPLKNGHLLRGIGTYTQNLLAELNKRRDVEVIEFGDINHIKDVDLVHYPFFDLFKRTLPHINKIPVVVTIHDVIPLKFPQHYPAGLKGSVNLFLQKRSLKKVSAVITDSNSSKKDINKYLKVPLDKIFTVYLGAGDEFKVIKDEHSSPADKEVLKETKEKYNLPEKFALFVGNVNWNKNLLNLAEAAIEAKINLVLVSSGFSNRQNLDHPELKSFKEFLQKYEDNSLIKMIGFVDPEDLAKIINLADCLALPSYYEGFGLPIIEAQACGVPVITSNVSSMPEVAGEGALLVDPENVTQIKNALTQVLNDEEVRNDLIERGFENLKRFSWKKCAKDTVNVYKHILNQK